MRYAPAIDIFTLTDAERERLPIGQWVTAGPDGPKGRFLGHGRNTQVVAWLGNAKGSGDYRGYMTTLRTYALSLLTKTQGET